jgi:chromosomal replication initiation ATPase DnaA
MNTSPNMEEAKGLPTPADQTEAVIAAVALRCGVTVAGIKGPRRSTDYTVPRQMAYAAVKQARRHLSLADLGRVFGRDHSTIHHGIRAHEARMAWAEILIELGSAEYQPDLFARAA